MFEEHPSFKCPNDDIKIWRYMDFTKFVSILNSGTLYFARADRFDDKFEGATTFPTVKARQQIFHSLNLVEKTKNNFQNNIMEKLPEFRKFMRKCIAINCWHMNDHESVAMWDLYLRSDEGIAIQSSCGRLKSSLKTKDSVYIGEVNYIDYGNDFIDEGNLFNPFIHKRKSYSHEKELRALICRFPKTDNEELIKKETIENGLQVEVDINLLVEKVFICPNAPSWFANLVESTLVKFGYNLSVNQSDLSHDPLF